MYTYDAGGRRTKVSGSLAKLDLPASISSAVYNAGNRLTSWAGSTFSYDLNGNLTSDGTNTYSWDARNQLASISGGVSASFSYDALGRRKSKTISSTQTGFVYDGLNFVQELTGSTVSANLLTAGVDELFQRKEGTATRYPIADALGSVIGLTDASGTLATEYSFEAYGKATRTGSADNNTQSFTSREDDGTGLFYYRARYYMPGCGRFISEDPLEFGDGPNVFAYVQGNPVSFTDPLGLVTWPTCDKHVGDKFGDPRPNNQRHDGVDIRAGSNAPIFSTQDGTVRDTPYDRRTGNHIRVDNSDGSVSVYGHTRPNVRPGQRVGEGDQIGNSDGSGQSTGPHLHYMYRPSRNGPKVDPLGVQLGGGSPPVPNGCGGPIP